MATVRYFEELEIGEAVETPARTVTEADVVGFAAISGDHEPLSPPGEQAGLPPIVPDLLVIALTSGLGFRVPVSQPQVLAFMVFESRFMAPVRVGDTLHCRLRVTGKRAMKEGGIVVERRETINQRGEVVHESEYKLLVARRPGHPTGGAAARP